ncbi:MAG: hypothetical protein NC038_03665 [Paludibacter sp.]|nr:hypothetical protein [Bacteroidales bacterium]MCM1069177.1 hypothetical protein [Prevotella sp.]MCM1354082.1 hypothetical protein [Bacteroides sp.]MCM1442945.1 hypothetical protein [Muribaculum sp.]MCM1481732.1 hypothetical protein [Paludibacter sp.]
MKRIYIFCHRVLIPILCAASFTVELWHERFGCLCSQQTTDTNALIDVSGYPSGWYELLLLQDGTLITSDKLFVEH